MNYFEQFMACAAILMMVCLGVLVLHQAAEKPQAQESEASEMVRRQITMVRQHNSNVHLYVDRITGCHYWARSSGGITPRMNADGTQLCSELPS